MTYMLFEKDNMIYYLEVRLPVQWKPIDYEFLEREMKNMDDALSSLQKSKNQFTDRISADALIFHAQALKRRSFFFYSDIKWSIIVHFLGRLGFIFMEIADEPQGYPLIGVD